MASSRKSGSKKSLKVQWGNSLELGLIIFLVLLFLNLLSWPVSIVDESLDGSWQTILSYSLEHGLRYGDEVIFTYGPLGGLSSFAYSGYNHSGKYGFELFMRISLIVFLFRFLPNLTPYLKIGCGFVYLLILQLLPDVYETFFFFGMLSWSAGVLLDRHKKKRASWGLIVLGVAFIVTCSLVKFTLLIAGVFCLTVVAGFLLLHKRNIEAAVILGGYPVGFFAFWSLLGQRVGDIPDFLYGSYQVAKGYAMSMQLATGPQAFILSRVKFCDSQRTEI
jgi:hypothetical protein